MSDKRAPGIYLADVLTHIANHVMDGGDVQTWQLVSDPQKEFFNQLSQRERMGLWNASRGVFRA
jgi:hypothetical protein